MKNAMTLEMVQDLMSVAEAEMVQDLMSVAEADMLRASALDDRGAALIGAGLCELSMGAWLVLTLSGCDAVDAIRRGEAA